MIDERMNPIDSLPAAIKDAPLQLDAATGVRMTALMMSVKYHAETTIKDGQLYQQIKLENKPIETLTNSKVLQTAIEFERYLRGDYAEMADKLVMGDFSKWLEAQVNSAASIFDESEIAK